MTDWDISNDDLKQLVELNQVILDLELQVKNKLTPLRSVLLKWFKEGEISEFKLETVYSFKRQGSSPIFSVPLIADLWNMPHEEDLDISKLATGKNYNPYFGLNNHPLNGSEFCFVLIKALLLISEEKRKALFYCDEVVASIKPKLQFNSYLSSFTGEKYLSVRHEFWPESTDDQ